MSKILSPNKSKILGDKYKLGDEIGRGASGRVFKGLDLLTGDFVAIKQVSLENISQEDLDTIMQEIDLLKVLNHKNIVKYLGTLNTMTDLHIILEYVENGSLDNIIKPNKFGPLPESLAAVYIAQVLEGLVYLHDQGVIHRDIKGANILATKEGHVKLTDFGVATKLTAAGSNTNSSLVVGTPYWMAPEVIELSGACAQSDIWSVGCTVIELITSFPPHHDLGHYTALYRIVKDEMPPIPAHLSPELTDFLHQCFKKDAKQRPDAKTLLLHPWMKNSSRSFQSSVRKVSAKLSGLPEEVSMDSEGSSGDDQGSSESHRDASDSERDVAFEQDPDVASNEKPLMKANAGSWSLDMVDGPSKSAGQTENSSLSSQAVWKSEEGPSSTMPRVESFVSVEFAGEGKNALRTRIRKRSTRKTPDEKANAEGHLSLQDAEINKLVGSLKPEESEEVIVSTCQKLGTIFLEHPDQKIAFVTRQGLLPLVDLLEVRKIYVVSSVLQIINQIIKENCDFQEYACSVGLIPVVMAFATPDCPIEVRIQAAYFLQQLCESSSSTLQMFIACRGIPILVSFLEPDYAKRREMVHLAVDGICQIFRLPRLTQRNDFCRIAAMNGILGRLVNTLHNLNEATRIASSSSHRSFIASGSVQQEHSVLTDRSQSVSRHGETNKTKDPLAEGSVSSMSLKSSTEQRRRKSLSLASVKFTSQDWRPLGSWGRSSSLGESILVRQQGEASPARTSSSRPLKQASNRIANSSDTQKKQLQPTISLLEKEPPSRFGSRKFDYGQQNSELLRQGSKASLFLGSPEKKTTDGLNRLMTEFAEFSRHGREKKNRESNTSISLETENKKTSETGTGLTSFNEGTSHAGTSQAASDILSGPALSCGLLPERTTIDHSVVKEYIEKVTDLLLEFAQADTAVKSQMCRVPLLNRLFYMLKKLESPVLLKILRCIKHLSTDANCLENLQRVNAIKHLVPIIEMSEHPLTSQIDNEVLSTLFNLCKINKTMQEQAAENGIVPYLMRVIMSDSPLKQSALHLLCDLAHTSSGSREQLRACGSLEVYLDLLDDNTWAMTALDSLAACVAYDIDNRKIVQELLKNGTIQKLVKFFHRCPEQYFMNILEPFLKILRKSPKINTTLAINGLTSLLVERLNCQQDAMVRINLLKMIKAVYEHHPRPKQLIVENDLPQKLERLIEEQSRDAWRSGGQVLVKQLATALLKALHINTVL